MAKKVGKMQAELSLKKDKFDKGLKGAKSASDKFTSGIKKLGGILAGVFAISKIVQWGKALVGAYRIQKEGEVKLATVVKQRMGLGKKAVKSLLDQASAYQKIGVIGDEVQIAGMQQLATFLKQKKGLENLMPAMNNLLAQQKGFNAQAGDAVNIANMMGRVLSGQVSALSRIGITFTEAQEKAIRYGDELTKTKALSEIITDNVGNMNEELAKTDLGKIKAFSNLWGDLKEWLGEHIVPSLAKAATLFSKLITPKASKQLQREREDLNLLVGIITDELTLKEDRLELIKKLDKEYPDFLDNLNAEKVTNKELKDRLKEVNDEYDRRILVAIRQELIAKDADKLVRLFNRQTKLGTELIRLEGIAAEETDKKSKKLVEAQIEGIKKSITKLQDKRKELQKNYDATIALAEAELGLGGVPGVEAGAGAGVGAGDGSLTERIAPPEAIERVNAVTESIKNLRFETGELNTILADTAEIQAKNIELSNSFAEALSSIELGALAVADAMTSAAVESGASLKDLARVAVEAARKVIAAEIAKGVAGSVEKALTGVPFPFNLAAAAVAGAVAASLFNSIVPKFGDGGLVYGNTLANVGEYPGVRTNPEVIAPLDKLQSIMGNRQGNQKVEFIIEKDQLVGILELYNNQRNNF